MKALMRVINIKNISQTGRHITSGVSIVFQSSRTIETSYIYIINNNTKKYFKIIETSCYEASDYLTYKAIEFGSYEDKVSKTRNLDIRNYLDHEVFVLDSKEEIRELEKRASYT